MQGKFQRKFVLSVQDLNGSTVKVIASPFTIRFNIRRAMFGAPSVSAIQIENLNPDTRSFLRKDSNDIGFKKSVTLLAGHSDKLSTMITGNLELGYSERQGTTVTTTIQVRDGGLAWLNSNFSGSFPAGSSQRSILGTLAKSLEAYGLKSGTISAEYNQKTKRGNQYSGNALDIMTELTGAGMFIDNGTVHAITDKEYIKGDILVVNSETGLTGYPRRDGLNVMFSIILEPRAYIGQRIRVDLKNKDFNGDYIVREIVHSGIISETKNGECITELTCTSFSAPAVAVPDSEA